MKRSFSIILATVVLGCGGGGGETLTGILLGPMEGVSFETATLNGITGPDGSFEYEAGQDVRFYLGGTTLGVVAGAAEVSLFDLSGAEIAIGTSAINRAIFRDESQRLGSAINRAAVLRAIDSDSDPANGVQVTEQVAMTFTGREIDFAQAIFAFDTDLTVRRVLNDVNDMSILEGHRAIPIQARAASALYDWTGVDPEVVGVVGRERDVSGDGNFTLFETVERNADGNLTRSVSTDMEIAFSVTTELRYDEQGRFMSNRTIDDGGITTFILSATLNADGDVVERTFDNDGNGTPDQVITFVRNELGQRTTVQTDSDGDGTADRIERYEFDGDDRESRYLFDENGDGSNDAIEVYTYNDAGLRTRIELDSDADGTPDEVVTFTYNAANQQTERRTEVGGVLTSQTIFEYDADGNQTRSATDGDGDGTDDFIGTFSYDNDGNLVRSAFDSDADGTPENISDTVYNKAGLVTERRRDDDGDGTPERVETFEYDSLGNQVRRETDDPFDGTIDMVMVQMWAPAGFGAAFD